MIPIAGHTAIVLPHYGFTPWWSLMSAGIYEYLGDFRWHAHLPAHSRRVALTFW